MTSRGKIVDAIIDLDEPTALELADEMIKSGIDPIELLGNPSIRIFIYIEPLVPLDHRWWTPRF